MTATALITGGTGGLGGAVLDRFLADGWRVVAPVRDPARLGERPDLDAVAADLADPNAATAAVERAASDSERPLRAVVNLVGGFASGGRVHETPFVDFERQLDLNLRPTYLLTAAALPHLVAAERSAVVCVSSRAALRPFPGGAGYATAKAAVLAFVQALDVEYRSDGVRVNAVVPSVIDTEANRRAMPDAEHLRWVAPQEIADVIAFLCSDASAATSGAAVPVYGRA